MLLRSTAALLVAVGLGTGVLTSPAAAVTASADDTVSRSEYRAIVTGMTRRQLTEAVHGADYAAFRMECGVTRYYRGWDREHDEVAVFLGRRHTVRMKATAPRNGGVAFGCPAR